VPAAGDVISSFTALAFTEPHPHLNHGHPRPTTLATNLCYFMYLYHTLMPATPLQRPAAS
jgi:hypothetical protein